MGHGDDSMNQYAARRRVRFWTASSILTAVLFSASTSGLVLAQATKRDAPTPSSVRVPFVGCASDGQLGPVNAPRPHSKMVAIPVKFADSLAYYQAAYGSGALGPRGWYCFGTYGSNGANLYISPQPINGGDLLSSNWKGFSGWTIQISVSDAGTSGRFDVARVIARVFPAHLSFAQDVIAEGIEPASAFPSGPYPKDRLTYLSKEVVEFETPAETEGMGTTSRLQKGDRPIRGAAILDTGDEPDLTQVWVRLPPDSIDLADSIIKQAECDAVQTNH